MKTAWPAVTSTVLCLATENITSQLFPESKLTTVTSTAAKIQELDDNTVSLESSTPKLPWAKFLPAISKQSHVVLNSYPNSFLQDVHNLKEYQAFNALIYSSFDHALLD